jgi:Ca2+-binding RTX toxin-like protein
MKAYADAKGTPLSDAAIDGDGGIVTDMAGGYLKALKNIADTDPNGEVHRDINWQEAQVFHQEGFVDNGLAIDAWTLHEVFKLLGEPADVQQYWEKVLESAGDDAKELALALETLGLMVYGVDNGDPSAAIWLSRMATWHGLTEMAANLPDMFFGINPDAYMYFKSAESYLDPLVLDLDGDGIETVSNEAGIKFDFDGDQTKTGTGWVKADDGILVLDRNGSGAIDNGAELFGVDTVLSSGIKAANGFEALADLDTNKDGKFAANDTLFGSVMLWRDYNQDGISQTSEMHTLNELGILSIGVAGELHGKIDNANIITNVGIYTRLDSQTGGQTSDIVGTIDFAQNTFVREFGTRIPLADWVVDFPEMRGSGTVRDLREATMLSDGLRGALTSYMSNTTDGEALDRVLSEWADTSVMPSFSERVELLGGQSADIRFSYSWELAAATGSDPILSPAQLEKKAYLEKIQVLEAFTGVQYFKFSLVESDEGGQKQLIVSAGSGSSKGGTHMVAGSPQQTIYITEEQLALDTSQKALIAKAYTALSSSVYQGIKVKSTLSDYTSLIDYQWSDSGYKIDTSKVKEALAAAHVIDPVAATFDAVELATTLRTGEWSEFLSDWTGMLDAGQRTQLLDLAQARTGTEAVILKPNEYPQEQTGLYPPGFGIAYGGLGSDTYRGIESGTNFINGGEGNDTIDGGILDDVLIGGRGQDKIYGNAGNDIIIDDGENGSWVWGGEGSDTYIFQGRTGYVEIKEDGSITKGDVLILQDILSTEVQIKRDDSLIKIYITGHQFFTASIDRFFKDGEPTNRVSKIIFADGVTYDAQRLVAESSVATDGPDKLYTNNKGGQVYGLGGQDELQGGVGNDYLDGGADSDWLYANAGDDTLFGGAGDDSLYGGAGLDTYVLSRDGGNDFAYDLDAGLNRVFVNAGIDSSEVLVSYYKDALYGMTVTLGGTSDRMSFSDNFEVVFADGTRWDRAELEARALLTSNYADRVYGGATDEVFDGLDGDDELDGGAGIDTLKGGAGNDVLKGGQGRDQLDGGIGADYLDGGEGDDWLNGGIGDDQYYDAEGHNTFVFGQGHDLMAMLSPQTSIELVGYELSELSFVRESGNLLIQAHDRQASIKITDFFYNYYTPERMAITFRSGSESKFYDIDTISELLKVKTGTDAGDRMDGTSDVDTMYGMEGNDTLQGQAGDDYLYGGNGEDYLVGGVGNDSLFGGSGDDILIGAEGDDSLFGGSGNDSLIGEQGDDYLVGGPGDDGLDGGTGNNTVLYEAGGGVDKIYQVWDGTNTLILGQTIGRADLTFYRDSQSQLFIRINEDKDQQVHVLNFFDNPENTFLGVKLSDGTFISQQQITAEAVPLPLEVMEPWTEYLSENWVMGTVGNDTLYGDNSDNFLYGSSGRDNLAGGLGSDGYMVSSDLEYATIKDSGGINDVLYFYNMSMNDLTVFEQKGKDFALELNGGANHVLIVDFFAGNDSLVEVFKFSDGQVNGSVFL